MFSGFFWVFLGFFWFFFGFFCVFFLVFFGFFLGVFLGFFWVFFGFFWVFLGLLCFFLFFGPNKSNSTIIYMYCFNILNRLVSVGVFVKFIIPCVGLFSTLLVNLSMVCA